MTEWTTAAAAQHKAGLELPGKTPSARRLSRLLTAERDKLSKADALTVSAIETSVPGLATAHNLLDRFRHMLRTRDVGALLPWVTDTEGSLLASLGRGIKADLAAVKAALTESWSNG